MTAFLIRRVALIFPTLFLVSVLIFGLQQLLPGDPALVMAGENADPATIAFLKQKYHLDDPLPVLETARSKGLWADGFLLAIVRPWTLRRACLPAPGAGPKGP